MASVVRSFYKSGFVTDGRHIYAHVDDSTSSLSSRHGTSPTNSVGCNETAPLHDAPKWVHVSTVERLVIDGILLKNSTVLGKQDLLGLCNRFLAQVPVLHSAPPTEGSKHSITNAEFHIMRTANNVYTATCDALDKAIAETDGIIIDEYSMVWVPRSLQSRHCRQVNAKAQPAPRSVVYQPVARVNDYIQSVLQEERNNHIVQLLSACRNSGMQQASSALHVALESAAMYVTRLLHLIPRACIKQE